MPEPVLEFTGNNRERQDGVVKHPELKDLQAIEWLVHNVCALFDTGKEAQENIEELKLEWIQIRYRQPSCYWKGILLRAVL